MIFMDKMKQYRFLFAELVKRDFSAKYKSTALGMVWSMIMPLVELAIMYFIFGYLFGRSIHFIVFIFCGRMVYSFFSQSTTSGMQSLLSNAGIFSQLNVPKYIFLLSRNVSSLINFGLELIIFFIFVALDKLPFTAKFVFLLYPIGCLILFNLGVGLILSALYIFFRDMTYLYGIFTQVLMFFSAIFYEVDRFPEHLQKIFLFNPIYIYIKYFRSIVIDSQIPSLGLHLAGLGYAIVFLFLGMFMYKKYNYKFLYYI